MPCSESPGLSFVQKGEFVRYLVVIPHPPSDADDNLYPKCVTAMKELCATLQSLGIQGTVRICSSPEKRAVLTGTIFQTVLGNQVCGVVETTPLLDIPPSGEEVDTAGIWGCVCAHSEAVEAVLVVTHQQVISKLIRHAGIYMLCGDWENVRVLPGCVAVIDSQNQKLIFAGRILHSADVF